MSRRLLVVSAASVFVVVLLLGSTLLVSRTSDAVGTGDLIAYSCKEQNNAWYAICVVRADGTDAKRLTQKVATTDPIWSPDGVRIAFTRHETGGEYSQSTQDDIVVMDSDGSDQRQVTPDVAGQSSFKPTWSPDGEHIAFLRSNAVFVSSPMRYGDLFTVNLDGSGETRLTRGKLVSGPAWSPDGQRIAMAIGTRGRGVPTVPNTDIYVVNVAGEMAKRLTETPSVLESAPAWSPDGSRIAFARWRYKTAYDGRGAIFVMKPDGSGQRLVLSPRHFASGPYSLSWSPDGRSLAFETSSMLGCTSISTVNLETNNVHAMTSCKKPREASVAPSWQPARASESSS
jgi:Tol biopolymer transport system component